MSAMKTVMADIAELHESGLDIHDFQALVSALGDKPTAQYLRETYDAAKWAESVEFFLTLIPLGDEAFLSALASLEARMRASQADLNFIVSHFAHTNPVGAKAFMKVKHELEGNARFVSEIRKIYKGE